MPGTSSVAESPALAEALLQVRITDELERGLHARGGRARHDLVVPELRDLALDDPVGRFPQVAARLQDGLRRDGPRVFGQTVVGVLQQRLEFDVFVKIQREELRQHGVADRIAVR